MKKFRSDQEYLAYKYKNSGRSNGNRRYFPSGLWYDEERDLYIRYWRGRRSKYLKNVGNRRFRKTDINKFIGKSNAHKKVFDFWWELY